jgi:hypothetical protein
MNPKLLVVKFVRFGKMDGQSVALTPNPVASVALPGDTVSEKGCGPPAPRITAQPPTETTKIAIRINDERCTRAPLIRCHRIPVTGSQIRLAVRC